MVMVMACVVGGTFSEGDGSRAVGGRALCEYELGY